jgi:glycine cleavage system aminomethyltransferase T
VTRLGACEFLVVTAAFTASHVLNWLRDHIGDEECTTVTDISGALGMLNIQGPESRALLASVSEHAFDTDSFPFATMQEVEIGYCQVRALRITYCGELGWELYVPTEYLQQVYDRIVASGNAHGLQHCGYHALNSLRIEKAYREFAHDIGGDDSPVEAGCPSPARRTRSEGFWGWSAFSRARQRGRRSAASCNFSWRTRSRCFTTPSQSTSTVRSWVTHIGDVWPHARRVRCPWLRQRLRGSKSRCDRTGPV